MKRLNPKSLIIIFILSLILFGLTSCMTTPHERNRVDLLPQNRPADWEAQRNMGGVSLF